MNTPLHKQLGYPRLPRKVKKRIRSWLNKSPYRSVWMVVGDKNVLIKQEEVV